MKNFEKKLDSSWLIIKRNYSKLLDKSDTSTEPLGFTHFFLCFFLFIILPLIAFSIALLLNEFFGSTIIRFFNYFL
jgi:hypothetical protein